jgi:hypothetical protein
LDHSVVEHVVVSRPNLAAEKHVKRGHLTAVLQQMPAASSEEFADLMTFMRSNHRLPARLLTKLLQCCVVHSLSQLTPGPSGHHGSGLTLPSLLLAPGAAVAGVAFLI